MAKNPVSYYDGENITCFPSSNAKDFGKLHTEFNEARFVTRVAKKNFCIKNPSFVLSAENDIKTNKTVLQISEGEASINGMDIIASVPIQIDPPAEAGKWYVAFKLGRDNLGRDFTVGKYKLKGNVLGDLTVGVQKTFEGMYLTYYNERLDEGNEDPDMLYLGSIEWDGNDFTNIEEDPQKYSRIEAEDVGCYIKDPKHADVYYMDLQSWLYKVPDWYFSKEGDVCYGEINVVPGRGAHPSPYQDPMPGFILRAYDKNTTKMVLKASSLENATLMRYGDINNDGEINDADLALLTDFVNGVKAPTPLEKELACVSGNRQGDLTEKDIELLRNYVQGSRPDLVKGEKKLVGKTGVIYGIGDVTEAIEIYASNSKVEIDMNHAQIYSNFQDDIFHIHNPEGICIESGSGDIKLEAYNDVYMKRFDSNAPTLRLTGNVLRMTDPNTPDLKHEWELIKDGTNQKAHTTTGKTIQEYDLNNKFYNILANDTIRMNVYPQFYMQNARNRCIGTLYFGPDDGNDDNYFKRNEIQLDSNQDDNVDLKLTDRTIFLRDENGGSTNSYIKVGGTNGNNGVTAYSNGNMELKNTTGISEIKFTGNSAANTARIWHEHNNNILHIDTNLHIKNNITADGDGYFNGGDVYIKNQGGTSNLYFTDGTKTYKIYHLNNEDKLHINTNLNMDNNNIENVNNIYANTSINVGPKGSDNKYPITLDKNGNIDAKGDITGKRVFGAVYNDYGEIFRKDKNEIIEYGDIVCLREDGLVHKVETQEDLFNLIGICSNTIGMCLGGAELEEDEKCPVGIVGKIWVKTDDMDLKPGDQVRATSNGTVVKNKEKAFEKFGIVMQKYENGKVLIFVK